MVEAFPPQRADEPLDAAVRLGRHHRRSHHSRADALGYFVERAAELRVVIARKRNLGPWPNGVSSRNCCANHSLVGSHVVTARKILRDPRCITTNTK
jgi:hypothetical protein